ncbi:MAG: L-aspartate oxidase [Vicinamibacterales bacterium]
MHTHTDFLIIGGGIAGLRAAIALAPIGRVLILTKASASESNTRYAQGGIAAALAPEDSPALHGQDTLRAGDGLCDEQAVQALVEDGARYVRELIDWGVEFDRDAAGRPAFGLEAAHSVRRVLHSGDATGRAIGRALWERVVTRTAVVTMNHVLVTELVVEEGHVRGARFFDAEGERHEVSARATLLATGGAGQVFRETTNPGVATGDGVALAYHAGARVTDLEFVQFHPTALSQPGAPRFLISEALRGEGARLVNASGEPFMLRHNPAGDLAPRDIVARGIAREMERTRGPVFLTLKHLDPGHVRTRFPTIAETCRQVGIDIATDPIPVGPAAHYLMGGIDTDEWGRTSIPGLYAAGEAACTGVHGANRLASNSLLEGLVFGARAAAAMLLPPAAAPLKPNRREAGTWTVPPAAERSESSPMTVAAVRDLMWQRVGLFRSGPGLQEAVTRLDCAYASERRAGGPGWSFDAEDWRRVNLLAVARLIARAALRREESRGGHFREDFPARDDLHWTVHLTDRLADERA